MDLLKDTGWDTDSDCEEVEEESSLGLEDLQRPATAATEEEEEDFSDPTGLLPRNCELRAKQKDSSLAASGDSRGSSVGGADCTEVLKTVLLGSEIAEKNVPRGAVDKAFYRWIREEVSFNELDVLFNGLPQGKRIRAQGRIDGTFTVGLRVVHVKLLDKSGRVGMRLGTSDVDIATALQKVCKVERVRVSGFTSAMAMIY